MNLEHEMRLLELMNILKRIDQHSWGQDERSTLDALSVNWGIALLRKVITHVAMQSPKVSGRFCLSDLLPVVAAIAAPRPSVSEVYAEIMHKAAGGVFQRPDRMNPRVRREGPPVMSSEFVRRVVSRLRPWADICSGEANRDGGLYRQVEVAYKAVEPVFDREIIEILADPGWERHPLIQSYRKWSAPGQAYQIEAEAERPNLRLIEAAPTIPMPDEIAKRRLQLISKQDYE